MRTRRTFALAGLTALAVALPAAPAHAATYASNGVRCTIVGTAGNDRLTGTARHDVICGLGGDDTLNGALGDDTLDGGTGNDRLEGGSGNDTLLGGAGIDAMTGGDGNDRLDGGTGNDVEHGGNGADVVYGGDGADTLTGDAGNDGLHGGTGNDDLVGGSGSDSLAGDAGTNWCTLDSADTSTKQCVYDTKPPAASTLYLAHRSVDVTAASQIVSFSVYLTDDTGVVSAQVNSAGGVGRPQRTSGDVRGGWWTSSLRVPQFLPPGAYDVDVFIRDRVGRYGSRTYSHALTVVDRAPDLELPKVASLTLSAASIDVRTAAETVVGTARVTDDRAGAWIVNFCPVRLVNDFWSNVACTQGERVSGTARNAVFRAEMPFEKGAVGGDWEVEVWVTDAPHNGTNDKYVGPKHYALVTSQGNSDGYFPLPDGAGSLNVVGPGDANAPVLSTVTITPPSVDTLPSSQAVTVDVAAHDVEGISRVGVVVTQRGGEVSPFWSSLDEVTSGTAKDGTWHFDVEMPQGTPPGTYDLQVYVVDATHFRSWMSAGSPAVDENNVAMTPAQTPGSDGTITVVQHPS